MVASVWPMAWRWQRLLAARGVHELARLARPHVLRRLRRRRRCCRPRSAATRRGSTRPSRRHRARGGAAAGTVLLERALGGAATLLLAAAGFALAVGRYDVGGYLWVELAFVVGCVVARASCSSRRGCTRLLQRTRPLLRWLRVDAPAARRLPRGALVPRGRAASRRVFALTLVVQAVRVLAIWAPGRRSASTSRRGRTT